MQSHNDIQLDRNMLFGLLDDLQQRTYQVFGGQIRLFVHGGAVMILHPLLSTSSTRRTTRDVDYIRRAFGHEWRKKGVYDAEDRLQSCINATAHKFRIGCVLSDPSARRVLNAPQHRLDERRPRRRTPVCPRVGPFFDCHEAPMLTLIAPAAPEAIPTIPSTMTPSNPTTSK